MKEEVEMEFKKIPISKIDIGEGNVRTRELTKEIDELKKSIQLIGLQQPPIVFPKGDRYELIVGQRRLIAVKELGWKEIPVLVRKPLNLTEAKIASISENIQRVKLSARDMSDVCNYLLEKLGSTKAVADALGVTPNIIGKYLGYKIVPESIKKIVEKEKRKRKGITPTDAIKIFEGVNYDEEKAKKLLKKLAKTNMTRYEKERVFDVLEESPEEPINKIFKKAEKARVQREIIIILPEKYATALVNASEKLGMKPEDVAKTAVTEWLNSEGYVD